MHTKTMEGLVGARTNMNLLHTPFRVFKEAEQRGDTGTMERAMGYVNECSDKAEEYMEKAEKGMKEDAKEAREKAELERENAIQKWKEERKEFEKRVEEGRNTDVVDISKDSKVVHKENASVDSIEAEPVIYTKTGEVSSSQPESGTNISDSV